jgi:hypothetical protein
MADVVEGDHRVSTCRWGALTLSQPYPHWLAAEDCPWTCVRLAKFRPLETTEDCTTCASWSMKVGAERSNRGHG